MESVWLIFGTKKFFQKKKKSKDFHWINLAENICEEIKGMKKYLSTVSKWRALSLFLESWWYCKTDECNCYTYRVCFICLSPFRISLVMLLFSLFFFTQSWLRWEYNSIASVPSLNRHSNPSSRLNEKVLSAILLLATPVIPRSPKLYFCEKKSIKQWRNSAHWMQRPTVKSRAFKEPVCIQYNAIKASSV